MSPSRNLYRPARRFNLTALLASGDFHVDESRGYSVATGNGTRYRLPSGPPEGRTFNELQPVVPPSLQLADSADPPASVNHVSPMSPPSVFLNPNISEGLQNASFGGAANGAPASHDEGAVVVFTLVFASLALLTNLALALTTIWWWFCRKRRRRRKVDDLQDGGEVNGRTTTDDRERRAMELVARRMDGSVSSFEDQEEESWRRFGESLLQWFWEVLDRKQLTLFPDVGTKKMERGRQIAWEGGGR